MKRVLFIGHDATLSGAPMVLLNLLTWLKKNSAEIEADVLLLRGGEIVDRYRVVADTFVLPGRVNRSILSRGVRYIRKRLFGSSIQAPPDELLLPGKYELVLGNTVATLEYLKFYRDLGCKTICWLHELEYTLTRFYSRERFLGLSDSVDSFIVPSTPLKSMLTEFGVEKKSHIVPDFIAVGDEKKYDPALVRQDLDVPKSAFVVGGCGTIERRKGCDLFVRIASNMTVTHPDIYFVWIGGSPNEPEYRNMVRDIRKLGLEKKVIITGKTTELSRFMSAIDLFALTSREDPFPLVCLEAAALEKPTICFENAGGIPEFVEKDAGKTVPYGDLEAFGEAVSHYFEDRSELADAGRAAKEKIVSRFSIDTQCRKINQILIDL